MSLALLVLSLFLAAAIFALTVGWLVLDRKSKAATRPEADAQPETEGPGDDSGAGDQP